MCSITFVCWCVDVGFMATSGWLPGTSRNFSTDPSDCAAHRCCAPVRGCGRPGTAARAYSAVTEQFAAADQTAGRVDKNDERAEGTQGLDWTHWTSTWCQRVFLFQALEHVTWRPDFCWKLPAMSTMSRDQFSCFSWLNSNGFTASSIQG